MKANYFVSPHLDDVVLSCGGYVRRLVSEGERVLMASVFTADPPPGAPISRLARRIHRVWRAGDTPYATRRREDLEAASHLGAASIHLGFLEAVYRRDSHGRPLYAKSVVNVPVADDDWRTCEPAVRRRLAQILQLSKAPDQDRSRVFCPAAIGGHVDHIIVRRAVETLCSPSLIIYYEDYPYADRARASGIRGAAPPGGVVGLRSVTIDLTPAELGARIDAIGHYASQLASMFPSPLERGLRILRARLPFLPVFVDLPPHPGATFRRMAERVRAHVTAAGGERYWHFPCVHAATDQHQPEEPRASSRQRSS